MRIGIVTALAGLCVIILISLGMSISEYKQAHQTYHPVVIYSTGGIVIDPPAERSRVWSVEYGVKRDI